MPRILTTCPTTRAVVPTGLRTSALDIATMRDSRQFSCPTCHEVHSWTAQDAIVEKTLKLSTFRDGAAPPQPAMLSPLPDLVDQPEAPGPLA